MAIKLGFYKELDELQSIDKEASFGFLENVDVTKEATARKYLHGYCDEFAAMLSDVFGYKIEAVRNADGRLIHAYCVSQIGGQKAYIDVRGITTDPCLFYKEFKNELFYYVSANRILVEDEDGYEIDAEIEQWSYKNELFEGEYEGWEDKELIDFIKSFADYYDVNRCVSIEDQIRIATGTCTEKLNDNKNKSVIER